MTTSRPGPQLTKFDLWLRTLIVSLPAPEKIVSLPFETIESAPAPDLTRFEPLPVVILSSPAPVVTLLSRLFVTIVLSPEVSTIAELARDLLRLIVSLPAVPCTGGA